MRRGIVGLGLAALVATGLTAPPAQAQPSDNVQAQAVTPSTNPAIEETCGLDATLILDASGSISSAGAVNTVRGAADDLIGALKDTNSTLRVTQFATFSGELSARVPVNAATTGPGGALSHAVTKYYNPLPPRPSGVNIYRGNSIDNSAIQWTNWEDGVKAIDRPELAIFMTDGDPTAYNVSATRTNVDASSTGTALDNAITQANILKSAGTRMLVVGVGSGLTSTASQDRLKKISGPNLEKSPAALAGKTINQVDAVAFSDFDALGTFLRSVVTSLCGNSVTIQKLAQTNSGADYVPATGWDMTVQPTVTGGFSWVDPKGADDSAQTRATSGAQGTAAFQWKPKQANQKATVQVTEAVKTDFTAENWTCEVKASDGKVTTKSGTITNQAPSFQFEMNPSDVAACKIYNGFVYAPHIDITKVAKDNPVRGNAAGWDEEYTFTVTNTGNTPLKVAKPVDPKCTSISVPTGDGAGTGTLQPGTSWTYTCQSKIGPVSTVTTGLEHNNTVSVTGIAPNGSAVSDQDQETVDVRTPAIAIDKTAKKTDTGTVINDGDTVPAGTRVTYGYALTNAGNDPLTLVRATAVTDDKCSPVTYKSGDTNNNQVLETTETWLYECTQRLNPPSTVTSVTNTGKVTSNWSGWTAQGQNNGPVTDEDSFTINVDVSASLRIIKVTNPGKVDQDFHFTVSGNSVPVPDQSFDLNTNGQAARDIMVEFPQGTYTITETKVNGWDLTDLDCDAGFNENLATGVITLSIAPAQDVTCTFTNERLPSLTVSKQTSPSGANDVFGFSVSDAPPAFDLSDGQNKAFPALPVGPRTITEDTVPAGWQLDDISCTGTSSQTKDVANRKVVLDLDYGEEVHCVFTNAQLPPPKAATVKIVKQAEPADGTSFDFTAAGAGVQPADEAFSLAPNGEPASRTLTIQTPADGSNYTFTEGDLPMLWNFAGVQCVNNGDVMTPVSEPAQGIEIAVDPGDTITCTFRNVKDASITVVKQAPSDPQQVFTFEGSDGQQTLPFPLKDQQSITKPDLNEGNYVVRETDIPADWYLDGPNGAHPTCTGADVSYDVTHGVTVHLKYGDNAVCTFADFFNYEPSLELVKQVDHTVFLEGKPAKYTYAVTNTGNTNLYADPDLNGALVDDMCDAVTVTSGSNPLAPGETWDYECTVASMTKAKATNKATVTVKDPQDQPLKATDSVTVEVKVPKLELTKTVDQSIVYPGTEVTYTYVVRNAGETPFRGPANKNAWMSDDKCTPVTYVSGDTSADSILGVGESWTYTCSSTINENTTNTATVKATPFLPTEPEQVGEQMQKTDTADVEVIESGITISKTPSAPGAVVKDGQLLVPSGSEVTYTYRVTSGDATVPMKVLDVTDDKCSPVVYQSGDDGDGFVEPGETWVYTCTSEFTGSKTVENTVVVTALEPILGDVVTDNDKAKVTSYVGSIGIKKSPSAQVVPKGSPVTYTYDVTNDGSVDLTDVTVTDDKCAPVSYKSGDDGSNVLKVGQTWKYACTSVLDDDTLNVATASGTTPSGGKVTDSTSVRVLVVGGSLKPAIGVTKKASAAVVDKGGNVTYTYEVKNTGNMALANIRVTDDKCAPLTYVSGDDNADGLLTSAAIGDAPEETWIYTCTTSLQATTTNTVTALGSPWSGGQVVGPDVSAQAQATVQVTPTGKKPLPVDVKTDVTCKGSTCTLVKKSKTNKYGKLKYRVHCRPLKSSAAGEVSYCRTSVSKKGAVKVHVKGYKKIRVTLWIVATPKPKYKDTWKANSWKRTWVLRPKH